MPHCDVSLELGRLDHLKYDILDTERKNIDQKSGHRDLAGFRPTRENDCADAVFKHLWLYQASLERACREAPYPVGKRSRRRGRAPRIQQLSPAGGFGR